MGNNSVDYNILDDVGATGAGKAIFAKDFKNVIFSLDTDGGTDAALTVKFQGSTQETKPDFGAAQSVTNKWDYIEVINLQDGDPIDGDTGFPTGSADKHEQFEANVGRLNWICAVVTARTAGEVTIGATLYE